MTGKSTPASLSSKNVSPRGPEELTARRFEDRQVVAVVDVIADGAIPVGDAIDELVRRGGHPQRVAESNPAGQPKRGNSVVAGGC